MIKYNNTNNASTTLTAWISASSTTLIVENGDILPTAPFLLTLEHFDNEKVTVREIVKCIAKAWNILTIQRGAWTCVQDDTATPKAQNNTPHSFSVWDVASIYWTSEQVQDIQNEIEKKLNIDDFQAWTYVYGATSTWTDAYSITIPWTLTSYSVGQVFRFMADTENTWNATLNVNGIWEKEILKNHDQHLQSGDIEAGQIVEVAYDGTNFQMDSQIASVISLDDISSLSYNDTTCYAWEEIHENDLIVTNGNSFNPDRADEDLSVWGQTVNKYAIWFIGNGESTDTFSIKTSVIEWFEPNSVTINIESDDNWKPSGTALATNTGISSLKVQWVSCENAIYNSITQTEYDNIWRYLTQSDKDATFSNRKLTAKWISMDFSSLITWSNSLLYIDPSDKYFIFYESKSHTYNSVITTVYTPNLYSMEWATVVSTMTQWELWTAIWYWSTMSRDINSFSFTEDWTKCFVWTDTNSAWTIRCLKLTTPFDLTSSTEYVEIATQGAYNKVSATCFKTIDWKYILIWGCTTSWWTWSSTYYRTYMQEINIETLEVWSASLYIQYSQGIKHNQIRYTKEHIPYCYLTTKYRFQPWSDFSTAPGFAKITFSSPIATTKGTKYRLTIAPVVTWSVVDSVKIYDKEGEYYSECAVRDLNSWSNVSNKTPYIDSSCILARYARKEKEWDTFSSACGWFANGDFTEFENVQYTFKGLKTGFPWLESDTAYYSTWDWWIATDWAWTYVWKAANDTSLLVDIDTSKGPKNKDRTLSVDKTDTSTYEFSERVTRNERIYISWNGKVTIYRNWVINASFNLGSWSTTGISTFLFEWDTLRVTYGRYDSSYWCSATVSFS